MVWPTIQPAQSDKHVKRADDAKSIKSTSVPMTGSTDNNTSNTHILYIKITQIYLKCQAVS